MDRENPKKVIFYYLPEYKDKIEEELTNFKKEVLNEKGTNNYEQ